MVPFAQNALAQARPPRITSIQLPRRQQYASSLSDWRDMVLYFLLPDRFSDGLEANRPLLNRQNLQAARPPLPGGAAWQWDNWAISGRGCWQGGTLQGITTKLNYLQGLGINALWIGPIFKQRGHLDTYHGYGIQDFLDVDPHFGTRQDLVNVVTAAHQIQMRVILDVVFNHSGANWLYPGGVLTPPYLPYPQRYPFGAWRGNQGQAIGAIGGNDDGVWPIEIQDPDCYTRAGNGSLDATLADLDNPVAEHKRTDFGDLRDFDLDFNQGFTLTTLLRCYQYWIALTDCDGFRIDTLKHVTFEEARNFCGAIKEFAANLGKSDFFLVGEIGGGDDFENRYLDVLDRNLNAALDIGQMVPTLQGVAKGLISPRLYFNAFIPPQTASGMGSHRNTGLHHVSILDDHDHISGEKIRFSVDAASDYQVVAAVALQLFSLGIPCIYYGTEQAFSGPEAPERQWLPEWKSSKGDFYLREAMFGPANPHQSGRAGLPAAPNNIDRNLPGFGPFGTAGQHCFDANHPAYVRITNLTTLRNQRPVLRYGRQYQRHISLLGGPFVDDYPGGELVAWSRILNDEEAMCIINAHGTQNRGADVEVSAELNLPGSTLQVILNTAEAAAIAAGVGYAGPYPVGSRINVNRTGDGRAFVSILNIPPSEVLVLTNYP
jgi:glycosidase